MCSYLEIVNRSLMNSSSKHEFTTTKTNETNDILNVFFSHNKYRL